MLGKKENGVPTGSGQTLNTIIGRGTVFEGTMTVDNSVRIDGVFKGELTCSGALTISQAGEAYAELEGNDIYINGVVRGTVRGQKVRLDTQARFIGDIHTGVLSVAEGAIFHGSCAMEASEEVKKDRKLDGNRGASNAAASSPASATAKADGPARQKLPGKAQAAAN